jgi:hypothetical protein
MDTSFYKIIIIIIIIIMLRVLDFETKNVNFMSPDFKVKQ